MFSHQTLLFIQDVFQRVFEDCLDHPMSRFLTPSKMPLEWQSQIDELTPIPSGNDTPITTPALSDDDDCWNKEEIVVRSVLSKLANIAEDKIERHIPIYRFGLDSIGAVQLSASLRRENRVVSAVDIMANPTVAGIASSMKFATRDDEITVYDLEEFSQSVSQSITSAAGLPEKLEAVLPCSPVQQGMISQFLMSEGKYYFNFSSWTLDSDINNNQVLQAWIQLVARHQILRTGFIPVNHPDSSFAMVVHLIDTVSIPVISHQDKSFNIQQWRTESAQQALHTLYRPPWRVALVDQDTGKSTMHLAMHHALYDAHSLRELLHDLASILSGGNEHGGSSIKLALSHVIKSTDSRHDSEEFWKSQSESLVVNSFPTFTPLRVEKQTFSTVSGSCHMTPSSLRERAAEAGITIQAALQGAWARLLSAYHGEMSVTFGVVLDGRTSEEARQAVFPMISTMPVLAQNFESNQELLHSMLQYNVAIRRYEHTPLSSIQRWLGRPYGRLFDTILVYQVADTDSHRLPWTILNEIASVEYPVSLEVEEAFEELKFNLVFDMSILPEEQADMMLQQFDAILVDLVIHPTSHASDLTSQVPNLCSVLAPTHQELPSKTKLLHQLVEQTARQQPDRLSLEFVDELDDQISCRRWTYRELDNMGNSVAHLLAHCGVLPGSIVAICFEKCPEAYFSILGILKAGCAFLALDPSAPASRQEYILHDSKAACLLIAEGYSTNILFTPPVRIQEVGENVLLSMPKTLSNPSHVISPSDTCYCLYTSGTTGTPKGCLISHDNAVQAMLAFKELFSNHWDSESRWLQFASFHFDVSVLEQYWSWFVGITVVAAPRDLILSDLIRTISKLEITHIDLTPSLARLIHPDEAPSLCRGVFITGGEQLRQDVLENWGPKEVIYNAYGPTEATIGVTMFQRVPANGRSSNIGYLFPNVGGYVFHPGTEMPVLRGAVGEFCVSGRLVGKGYLNRPELTEERFPTLKQYGERVYRTGDLVRVLHDGSLDFLGRADDQVKLRGQRLEIGEINYAIKAGLSQVADVATLVARHGGRDRDLLVSFVTPLKSSETPKEPLVLSGREYLDIALAAQDACKGSLPGYMVPTYVIPVAFIPLSANNKVDLNSLKQIFGGLSQEQLRSLTSGTTGTGRELDMRERQIASILSSITGVEISSIQPSSTIFELGIDSITVLRVAGNLRGAGFFSAAPSLILKNPQISHLAQVLGQSKASTTAPRLLQVKLSIRACFQRYFGLACRTLGVSRDDVEYIAPCTPLQEGMLTRARTAVDHSAYFNHFCIHLSSSILVERLREAWTHVIDSCSILRTSFIQTPDGYVQVALKGQPIRWTESHIEDTSIQDYTVARRQAWIESNQNTMRYPVEIDYIKGPREHVLALRLFHAVYDAQSFELVLRNVVHEYDGTPQPPGPSFLEVLPYGPLLTYDVSRSFWETLFNGHIFQPIPKLTNAPSISDLAITQMFDVDNLEMQRIKLGVTYQTVLQAAWLSVLEQYFEAPPAIGVVLSGRSIVFEGVENITGPMFNTLPFRVESSDMTTWKSLIGKVHKYNTSVLDFVHTPLRDIQKWCSRGRQLFDILFAFDHEDDSKTPGAHLWSSVGSNATADYPLALEVVLTREGSLRATLVAQAGIANEETLRGLLNRFKGTLISLAGSRDGTVLSHKGDAKYCINGQKAMLHDTPDRTLSSSTDQEVTPTFEWTDIAKKLQREIAQLAGVTEDEVAETTSIFELGLDSIDAIKLAHRLNNIGVRVSTSDLMKRATIETILKSQDTVHSQAKTLKSIGDGLTQSISKLGEYLQERGIDLEGFEAVLPPTPLQDSMVADMLMSGFHRYFNHDVREITPDTNLDSLKSAWATVYTHSPILRTSFMEVDDPGIPTAFCQLVRKDIMQFSPMTELESVSDVQTVIEQARSKAHEANGSSALFQLNFVATPTSKYVVVSISHALYDGWSLDMLYRDVRAAYNGYYKARKSYEYYLSHILFSFGAASRDFWTGFMHNVHPTLLNSKRGNTEIEHPAVHRAEVLSKLNYANLKALCKTYGITPQVLSQGCWAAVLSTLAKSLDVTFGVVLSGRETDEAQGLLFPTMNTVPMRIILHGTVSEYLRSLQATMSEVIEFQHAPLRQIQKLANFKGQNLFDTLFILQNQGESRSEEGRPIMESVQGSSAVEYPICIEMELVDGSVIWRIACDERFGSADDATRILNDLDFVLHYFANNQDSDVVRFDSNSDQVGICGLDLFTLDSSYHSEANAAAETSHSKNDTWAGVDSPIVDVLAKLSGIAKDSINPDDSIYHLGLDSISAMKASSMLRKLGLRVSVQDMLKSSSIRKLVEHTPSPEERSRETPGRTDVILKDINLPLLLNYADIDPSAVENVLPALPMQVHMLTVWQNTGGSLFFPTFTYRITGQMIPETIVGAWKALMVELPVLRTRFVATGSSSIPFIQVIIQPNLNSDASTGELENIDHDHWRFRAVPTPFVSIRVDGFGSDEAHMCLRIHHALYDGVSLQIVMDRFAELCGADPSTQLPSSLSPWYGFVSGHGSPDVRKKAQMYWESYLKSASSLDLLGDHSNTRDDIHQVAVFKKDVIRNLGSVKSSAFARGVTLQALFFAAYAKVLCHLQDHGRAENADDVVFGVYMANRTSLPGLEEAPLPTLNILPLRVRSAASRAILSLVAEIQRDLQDISTFENSTVGLWEIHQWTGVKIDTFVNFLSLPEGSAKSREVFLEGAAGDLFPMGTQDDTSSHLASSDAKWLSRNSVRDCYVVSFMISLILVTQIL